jgi:recombinational DNA repair ATPase RecF
MTTILTSFTLTNFKSYREARFPLGPLTLLIGANASGKSNAIEALKVLSWYAQGQKLSQIQYATHQDGIRRGRVIDLCHSGKTSFSIGCHFDNTVQSPVRINEYPADRIPQSHPPQITT